MKAKKAPKKAQLADIGTLLSGAIVSAFAPAVKNPSSLPGDCNVKDYIVKHVTPYDSDAAFLAPPTARTLNTWKRCEELIELERQRGILDVDTRTASTVTSHGPGYVLSGEEDIIVGLQTDEPLKRACKPRGGFNAVGSALKSYGYQPDPDMAETYTTVCNFNDVDNEYDRRRRC
jgi:formate C-acetyltransferase